MKSNINTFIVIVFIAIVAVVALDTWWFESRAEQEELVLEDPATDIIADYDPNAGWDEIHTIICLGEGGEKIPCSTILNWMSFAETYEKAVESIDKRLHKLEKDVTTIRMQLKEE